MTRRSGPGVRALDVLGVPVVPPGGASRVVSRLHGRWARVLAASGPPPVAIVDGVLGVLDAPVLAALCRAGVPDALRRPTTVADLAAHVGADADRLERLLRYGAVRGWVRLDRRGRIRPSGVTRFLRSDHPGGWRAWVEFAAGDDVAAALGRLSVSVGSDRADGFAAANGAPFFEHMAAHPERAATFDGAMAAGARLHGLALAAALRWRPGERLCDLGGGTGELLAVLADRTGVSGTVVDLPHVVARAVEHPRVEAVAGDLFDAVPAGFDTYLLVNVVHDWGDDEVVRMLSRVAEVLGAARLVVVDADRPDVPFDRIATGADVLMAALTGGGRERDASAVAALAQRAGLRLVDTKRLASGDLAHELRSLDTRRHGSEER